MGAKTPDTSKASQITADASVKAAEIQAASEKENRALQGSIFDKQIGYLNDQDVYNRGITQQNQANYNPYIQQGSQALSSLSGAVNDPNSWANQSFTGDNLAEDPGYQFRLQQGQNGLNNSLAAKGGLLSGAALKATDQYNQGFASDEFNNAYSRFTNDKNNRISTLSNIANMGLQGAAGFAGGSPASTTGAQLSNVASQYSNNLGNIIQNGANAQSNNVLSTANAQAQLAMAGQARGASPLAGAASGAAAGASFGPWGALAGGVIGGLSSLL